MASMHVKLWDRLFLKTTFSVLFLSAVIFFIDGRWGLGIFLILVSIFGVGGIGQALHSNLSAKELAPGGTDINPNEFKSTEYLDPEESYQIAKAMMRLAFLLFTVMLIIGFFRNLTLWRTLLIAVLTGVAVPISSFVFFVLIGLIQRCRSSSKNKAM